MQEGNNIDVLSDRGRGDLGSKVYCITGYGSSGGRYWCILKLVTKTEVEAEVGPVTALGAAAVGPADVVTNEVV